MNLFRIQSFVHVVFLPEASQHLRVTETSGFS